MVAKIDAEVQNTDTAMDALFTPDTVAVIGASRNPQKVGYKIIHNLIQSKYQGTIVPVNPSGEDILGLKSYRSLAEFGSPVEQSVIVIPREHVRTAVSDSITAGAKAISIITAGFKEQDAFGAALEKELSQVCRDAGVRMLGPNCLGMLNTHHNLDLSFGKKWPMQGNIAFVSQSGALCAAILDRAAERKFGLSKMVSIGNKADLAENDFLAELADDPQTDVIVAYLESIDNGRRFMAAAETAGRKKPVIIFKSGVTSAGSRAASSHTGSLAGADVAYETAFKRCGVVRARTYEQMFEFAVAFAGQPLPKGRRVAVITNAGGPGIMTADAVELCGLQMTALEDVTAEALRAVLPKAASVKNPIDVLGDAAADRYVLALKAAQADPNVDAVIVLLTPQAVTLPLETAKALCDNLTGEKPVLACFLGGEDVNPARELMLTSGLPDYRSPEKAVHALKAMCDYAEWRALPARSVDALSVDRKKVEEILINSMAQGSMQLGEVEAKAIFRAYGIQTPAGALATTPKEVAKKADELGYPLVMKIVSPDILHKSDIGGVKLNLKSRKEVNAAYRSMMESVSAKMPKAYIVGVYLERMSEPGGREVILGMTRDPQFGAMLMFGLGGIFVEVLKDVTFRLAPLTADEARQMIRDIKAYPLLEGVRGQAGVDIEAIVDSIQRLSQLVTDFPVIKELDINPFIVKDKAGASAAVDGRMTLALPA